MLSEEQNRALTEVGAGTPMGELLRRYWMPIAAVAELDDHPTKPVRLMGENLVLFKDKAGAYGLQDESQDFIERVEGDVDNVIGLPVARLREALKSVT